MSETCLDSSTALGNDSLEIPGYNLVRCDHSSNTKLAGVCVVLHIVPPIQSFNPLNPTGRIHTSQQICLGAHGMHIYVTMMISGSCVKIIPPFRASHEKKKTFSDNVTILFLNASFTREYTKMKV